MSLKLTIMAELQYHSEQNKVYLFESYWYETNNIGIRLDPHHGLVEINLKAIFHNVYDVFVFAK